MISTQFSESTILPKENLASNDIPQKQAQTDSNPLIWTISKIKEHIKNDGSLSNTYHVRRCLTVMGIFTESEINYWTYRVNKRIDSDEVQHNLDIVAAIVRLAVHKKHQLQQRAKVHLDSDSKRRGYPRVSTEYAY